jgi:predicted phosphodiesterase
MRIALFSDVHGNLSALEAVLAGIATKAPDLTLFAGDLCLDGPRPADCLRLLRAEAIPAIYGNTDAWILGRDQSPEWLQPVVEWTAAQLTTSERDWLARLPFSLTVNPTADPSTGLHVVHANPQDVNRIIFPPEADQPRYTKERQPDADVAALLQGLPAHALAFGHLHIPSIRHIGDYTLLNISSVSMAGDGDPRAKYALATWDGYQWTTEHVRVEYDITAEIAAFRASQPPVWEHTVAMLETEGMIAHRAKPPAADTGR